MKKILFLIIIANFTFPNVNFAQAPNLGAANSFALFTAVGAFTNSGLSFIVGDIGTNAGTFLGFPQGVVNGQIHVTDAISLLAAADVELSYNFLKFLPCGAVLSTSLGNNQTVTPNTYCLGAASTLTGNLTLDAQGNPNAIFIFQIDGAFATSTFSHVILINGAQVANIYWQVNGQFDLGDYSLFQGNMINSGAINLLEGAALNGRALSRAGAINLNNNQVNAGNVPLAVHLSDFKASNLDKMNLITWSVSAGTGDYFELEKSTNATGFAKISSETAKDQSANYSYIDYEAHEGTSYYRLKMLDASGNYTYSAIVSAFRKSTAEFSVRIYPNPVGSVLNLSIDGLKADHAQLFICDMTGKEVIQKSITNDTEEISMSGFAPGLYFVKYKDDENSRTVKINKR